MENSEDKRDSTRAITKIEIFFKNTSALIKSYMLNVSRGGLFIKTDAPFQLGTEVFLKFTLPNDSEPIEAEGMVVWSNPKGGKGYFPRGMGIKFVKMQPKDLEKIKNFIEKHHSQIENLAIL